MSKIPSYPSSEDFEIATMAECDEFWTDLDFIEMKTTPINDAIHQLDLGGTNVGKQSSDLGISLAQLVDQIC